MFFTDLHVSADQLVHLREVPAPVVNDSVCQQSCYKVITDNMICAGELLRTDTDACQVQYQTPLSKKTNRETLKSFGLLLFLYVRVCRGILEDHWLVRRALSGSSLEL